MAESRKLSLGRGHYTVGDDFARRVLHIDDGVRREVVRQLVGKRNVVRLLLQVMSDRTMLNSRHQGEDGEPRDHHHGIIIIILLLNRFRNV